MTVQYRTNPAIGFELVSRIETFVTRPALDHAGWKCEACRNDDQLRVCVDKKTPARRPLLRLPDNAG